MGSFSRAMRRRTYPWVMELIHTCYRIGDIDRSVAFYETLGFEELRRMDIRDEAINVFMGLPGDGARLELTYNHGVESYELGTGYNHIALTVEDLDGKLAELAEAGIEPEKPPYRVREGGSRICFVRDPDGYRIELIESGCSANCRVPVIRRVACGRTSATEPSGSVEGTIDGGGSMRKRLGWAVAIAAVTGVAAMPSGASPRMRRRGRSSPARTRRPRRRGTPRLQPVRAGAWCLELPRDHGSASGAPCRLDGDGSPAAPAPRLLVVASASRR